MKFSANLGFLWADRPLPDAIRAAKAAGFDAVECHWPYNVPVSATEAALEETGPPDAWAQYQPGQRCDRGKWPCGAAGA